MVSVDWFEARDARGGGWRARVWWRERQEWWCYWYWYCYSDGTVGPEDAEMASCNDPIKAPFGTARTGFSLSDENTVATAGFLSPPLPARYSVFATVREKSRREKTGFLLQCCYSVFVR